MRHSKQATQENRRRRAPRKPSEPCSDPEYSGDTVVVTLDNQTGQGPIGFNSDNTATGSFQKGTESVAAGASAMIFTGHGVDDWPEGGNGTAIYNLPNNADQLVIGWQILWDSNNSTCWAMLQNQNGSATGCDSYFVTTSDASGESHNINPTITVYDATTATGIVNQTGSVYTDYEGYSTCSISIENQLTTWITLNDWTDFDASFSNAYGPVVTDSMCGVAPGSSGVVTTVPVGRAENLIYNITSDIQMTLQAVESNPYEPIAGFTGGSYSATVSGGATGTDGNFAYTVTVSGSSS